MYIQICTRVLSYIVYVSNLLLTFEKSQTITIHRHMGITNTNTHHDGNKTQRVQKTTTCRNQHLGLA